MDLDLVLARLDAIAARLDALERPTAEAPVAVTVAEAAARLGCSRSRVFELLRDGVLARAAQRGRATMVTTDSVDDALVAPPRRGPRRAPPRSGRRGARGFKPITIEDVRGSGG